MVFSTRPAPGNNEILTKSVYGSIIAMYGLRMSMADDFILWAMLFAGSFILILLDAA
jgi:hypothetical protein